MKWENTYKVFEVSKGPKVIIESLNTYGEDGWECSSMVTVANFGAGVNKHECNGD